MWGGTAGDHRHVLAAGFRPGPETNSACHRHRVGALRHECRTRACGRVGARSGFVTGSGRPIAQPRGGRRMPMIDGTPTGTFTDLVSSPPNSPAH